MAGCYELMRAVLSEENAQIMAAKARCDALYQRLEAFKVGGPDEFNGLTTTYCAAYEDLRGKVKPLWQSHCQTVERHYKDVIVFFELNRAIRKCVQGRSMKELAQEQCWAKGLSGFDGCAAIVVAFREHCRNKMEVARKDVRSALWMVGLIVLFFVGAMLLVSLLAPAAK